MATYIKRIKDGDDIVYPQTNTDAIFKMDDTLLTTALDNAIITLQNTVVPTSAWALDNTYADFPYKADIAITGCTANHVPDVYFSLTDATAGTFAPVAVSALGKITIYATSIPSAATTIPSIKCTQEI